MDSFRAALGLPYREITWDDLSDEVAVGGGTGFGRNPDNYTMPQGFRFDRGLLVSADSSNPTSTPIRFGNFDPSYPAQFQTFSGERLVSPVPNNNDIYLSFNEPNIGTP